MLPEGIIEMQFKHLYQDIEEQIKKILISLKMKRRLIKREKSKEILQLEQ